jgi:flavocytochrome c
VEAIYTPGTYTGEGFGMNGTIQVAVTVDEMSIVFIEILDHIESAGIADPAIERIPEQIIDNQSLEVESVAGATLTSAGIVEAVEQALRKAKGETAGEEDETEMAFDDPDVIIVGAGFAGINAAIEAADLGAKVLLIEQTGIIGGSIRYAGGTLSGANTQMQIDAGIEDTVDKFIEDINRLGRGTNIPELTQFHVENSAEAVNWIDSIGADFGDRQPTQPATYEAFGTPREHRVTGGGIGLLETVTPLLEAHIENGNVVLLLNTKVTDILMDGKAVTGVITEERQYEAKATILATGGYGHNEEWINRYNFDNVLSSAPAHATGDGYVFAEKAGAQFANMEYLPAYAGGVPVSETGFVTSVTANTTKYPGVIWVNVAGERMGDEIDISPGPKQDIWADAPENIVYILMTESMRETQDPILSGDEGWARFDEEVAKGEVIFKADTIEALAEATGIDASGLSATIERYNGFVENGTDEDFGRTNAMESFEEGPYYAIKTVPYVLLTKGGPLMNTQAQILDANNEPIVGLYQCGELIGGSNIGGEASVGGLANTICVVWGKNAARNAVAYALEQ